MNHEILYVTGNPGKFNEVAHFVAEHAPHITLLQYDCELPEIQSRNQRAIALQKAHYAWNTLKKPLLVDDSGIYFAACNEFPGTMTKFVFEGIGFEGIHALTAQNNRAYFHLHLVYMDHTGTPYVFEGHIDGNIIKPDQYDYQAGFPYNAIFKPHGSDKTYTELYCSPQAPIYSYRIQAVAAFLAWFGNPSN